MLMKRPNGTSAVFIPARRVTRLRQGSILLAGMVLANGVSLANSTKQYWPVNGHFYQRFDISGIIWTDAKAACEHKTPKAHLATITGQDEEDFIRNKLLADSQAGRYYHIGGSDAAVQNDWKWVATGEPWNYNNWYTNEPNSATGYDYLSIYSYPSSNLYNGVWRSGTNDSSSSDNGYICEWSPQKYLYTALVPDLNGNGVDEIAGLFVAYISGKHTVEIKDPLTDKLLSTLTFSKNFNPPQGLAVLKDITGNDIPEIAVLFTNVSVPNVQIKDAKDNVTAPRLINFLNASYRPVALNSSPDADGNGASEIVVLGAHRQTGKTQAEVRDSKTGLPSNNTPF